MKEVAGHDLALTFARRIEECGGRALIVGGYARDEALRRAGIVIGASKDIDFEVFGMAPEALLAVLRECGEVKATGEAFRVWKVGNLDVSIPRRDSKTGPGHKGFHIEGDPTMTFADAARRRDLTINALAMDPLTGEILDAWGGMEDVSRGILRATDPVLFGDDPLRVLRLAQFAGRFWFRIDQETLAIAQRLPLGELPRERVGEEWRKLLLRSPKPSIGLAAMRETKAIEKLHPELAALVGTPQDPDWHPEGDVWVHTLLVCDVAAEIVQREQFDEETSLVILLAALCHDLGKPATTVFHDGHWRSHGHSEAGEGPTRSFLDKLAMSHEVIDRTVKLVREHLWPSLNFDRNEGRITASDAAVRRLALRLHPVSIRELVAVAEADRRGRIDVDTEFPEGAELLARAATLDVAAAKPEPLLLGRHLIAMGFTPGPAFGVILRKVFEEQIEGMISTLEEAQEMAAHVAAE